MGIEAKREKLLNAVRNEDVETVEKLLRKGINPNFGSKFLGYTPLFLSIGNDEITKLLLEYGADPNLQSEGGGFTPLMRASWMGLSNVVDLLLEKGADVSLLYTSIWVSSNDNESALSYAADKGYKNIVAKFLKKTTITDEIFAKAVANAILNDHVTLVDYMLQKRKMTETIKKQVEFALARCALNGYDEMLGLLLDYGFDVNATDKHGGNTALILAAKGKQVSTVKLLLSRGANPNIKNNDGEIALDWVIMERDSNDLISLEIIALLTKSKQLSNIVDQFKEFKKAHQWNKQSLLKVDKEIDDTELADEQ